MARSLCWMSVAAALLAVGCGSSTETVGQVRDRYRPQMASMRKQLETLRDRVPGMASAMSGKLDPAPIYNEDGGGNTDFIAFERLVDSGARPPIELGLSHELSTALSWTGSAAEDDPTARRDATKEVETTFQHALATRYLVVVRTTKTKVTGQMKVYTGGDAAADAFVVDLKTYSVVASVSARGSAAGPINVDMPASNRRNERAETLLTGAAIAQLRQELAAKLSDATGGSFSFAKPKGVLAAGS